MATATRQEKKGSWSEFLRNIAAPIAVVCAGAVVQGRVDLAQMDARLDSIESNRFTDRDAKFATFRAEVEAKFAKYPPAWLQELVRAIDNRVRALEVGRK